MLGTIVNSEDPGPETEPLTASFRNVPAEHDGENAFTFEVEFSEAVGTSYTVLRDEAFDVSDGDVMRARRVEGRSDRWEITVEPDSDEAVGITLPGGRACDATGAVCTDDGRQLSNSASATVDGPYTEDTSTNNAATGAPTISGTAQVGEELEASTSGIADADGIDGVTFSYQWIRGGNDVSGATGSSYELTDANEGERIKVRVTFQDNAGNDESVTSAATDAVAAAPGTADGQLQRRAERARRRRHDVHLPGAVQRVARRELPGAPRRGVRGHRRRRAEGPAGERPRRPARDRGRAELERHGGDPVAGDEQLQCERRHLHRRRAAAVELVVGHGRRPGRAVSQRRAQAEENTDETIDFTVSLDRAASGTVTVDYATSDGSATSGSDYTAANGTLTFQAGERTKTVEIALLDDDHDEGTETFTLTLSNASGAVITDAEATGTIENHDSMPRALLARFGRTAAVHVVEHVEERLQASREPGFDGRFAGRELRKGMERDVAVQLLSRLGGSGGMQTPSGGQVPMAGAGATATRLGTPGLGAGAGMGMAGAGPMTGGAGLGQMGPGIGPSAMTGVWDRAQWPAAWGPGSMQAGAGRGGLLGGGGLLQMGLGGGDILTGSAFALNRETKTGGILSFWSRGAQSSFHGREGVLSLNGDVRTTMFGADYAKGRMVTGLSLARSMSLGGYSAETAGQVESAVTGLYPWLGYQLTERVSVWGVAGYGAGGMVLTPGEGTPLRSGLSMAMAAGGTRGDLIAGSTGGFALAFKADALWVGTSIDGVDGPAGRLKATGAAVTRLRTGLEGSRDYRLGKALSLTPLVKVGLRHDGGDAETGAGMDVGGGMRIAAAGTGLSVDVRVRMLLVHQTEGFRERGTSVSLSYNPTPSTPLGFSARVAPSWGGQATGGAQALWGRETMAGLAHRNVASGNRLDGEVGYGLAVGSRFVGTPRVGLTTSEYGRAYRLGYGMTLRERGVLGLELGVDAQRRESPATGGADNGVLGRATVRW